MEALGEADTAGGATIVETRGSCDNLKRLLTGEVDFGLVQYDVATTVTCSGLR